MYYPIFLNLDGRRCVVVGGGSVAERKVGALLARGADVVVISPNLTEGLEALARDGKIGHFARGYQSGDLEGARLVFSATDDRPTNVAVFDEAETRGVPANVVDDPELCSFTVPSVVVRGELQIAISSGGASPALAKKIRLQLEEEFGPEYATLLDLLARFRERVLAQVASPSARRRVFEAVAGSDLLSRVRSGQVPTVDELMEEFATDV